MKQWTIKCEDCGKLREFSTYDGYYEAKRCHRDICHSCGLRRRWKNIKNRSKYDAIVKKGNVYGLLTVISDKVESGCRVDCRCKCGKIISRRIQHLLHRKTLGCKKCLVESLGSNWKGIGRVPKMALIKIKNRAEKKHKEFNLSLEYVSSLFDRQGGRCALSGIELSFYKDGKPYQTASLDRIDSSKGYIEGNVQWLHKDVNFMKQGYSDEYFVSICKKISKYDKS